MPGARTFEVLRTRLTWVIVACLVALTSAAVVDSLRPNRSPASQTKPSKHGSVFEARDPLLAPSETAQPRCTAAQIAVSIDVLGGTAVITVHHARGQACHLAPVPVQLKIWDRAGNPVSLVASEEGAENPRVGGDFAPGYDQLVNITYLRSCNARGPFLAVATVGPHVARRTLSGDEVDCFRGGWGTGTLAGGAGAGYGERVSRYSLDHAVAGAVWAALAGGTVLLITYFVTPPTPVLLAGWLLFLPSVSAAFALAVLVARREGVGLVRAVGRGVRAALRWIFWLLP
jgi:hypothetical protein